MENGNITLVVTMHNQKELLEICLQWLGQMKNINRIILIDNGSEDGTAQMLATMGYEYIVFDEGKQGYGIVWNAAIDNFQLDDIVVFMDMRYIPGKDCFEKLAEVVLETGNVIAGPVSNGFTGTQYMPIENVDEMLAMERVLAEQENTNPYATVVGLDNGLWAISKEMLQKVGRFHEGLVEPQNVLVDYELRMIQMGSRAVVCSKALTFDVCCGMGNSGMPGTQDPKDRELLKETWNMNYFNRVPNRNLADLIVEEKEAEFHVLEVGCDLGATLLDIKRRYPNCIVHGVEINAEAVKIAKHLLDVKEGNIEEENLPFSEKFDYIIFGDVLEHLRDPQRVIRFCKQKLLNEQGCIIASIPNIMHVSVMQQLLNGRFEYQDMGLLDRTHIHFFTYYEILFMFQQEGYTVEEVRNTSVILTKEQEELKTKLMDISQNVEMYMYDTFQYIVKARSERFL